MMTLRRETLHFDNLHILVMKLCLTVMLVIKLLCWWWWIVSLVREINELCFFEDVQRGALIWHKDQKRHAWPGLLLMMTSRRESPYLSHETLSDCHMLVRKLLCWWWWIVVVVRERNEVCFIEDYQKIALMWHQDQKRRIDRDVATDDDIKKGNSALRPSPSLS